MPDQRSNAKNVFSGGDALKRFLNTDCNPPVPLVELPASLNPFAAQKVRIFAKLLSLLPLLNLKSLPVLGMLQDAAQDLDGVHTLVENSSGNTAFSLAIVARLFGINSVGADVRFAPPEGGGVALARRMGKKPGFRNLGQYENPSNIAAHAKWTAKQVWEQTEGKITLYATGLGKTGPGLRR